MSETSHVSPATLRKVTSAAAVGNFVEWFDFAVYGFLATTIAGQFFSASDPGAALLQTFAVFAVAFALRPWAASCSGRWATAWAASGCWRQPCC